MQGGEGGLCGTGLLPPLLGLAVPAQGEGRKRTSSMSHHFPDVCGPGRRTPRPGVDPDTQQHLLALRGDSHSVSSEPGTGLAAAGKGSEVSGRTPGQG